jgi:NAD(P)-dependent dehydrogenase (short-subunit alcohol dehydrogenase family)
MSAKPLTPIQRRLRNWAIAANRVGAVPTGKAGRQRALPTASSLQRAAAGKVVLITGASSGIGEATALLLGEAGATVLLVARTGSELERVRSDIVSNGGTAFAYECDLTDFAELDTMVAKVLADHGHVDVLVNNAGHSIRRRVERSDGRFHDFERLMRLNYLAAIRVTLGFLPSMRDRRTGQIINISSWAVQVRPARFSGYAASKAALEAWSDCVQGEVLDEGVLFTTIRMPLVRTPMIEPTKAYRYVPALRASEAAKAVGDAIVRRPRRLRPAVGQFLAVTEAISPRSMDRIRSRGI